MNNEKVFLTWHSYDNHFQKVLRSLFDTGNSSDVTLVCDDQIKFKAHKFVLKACSPVFESILQETNEIMSVVYLRGVNWLELKPILEFIYSGQASFLKERMKEFLRVGKDLKITQIKDVPVEENTVIKENVNEFHLEINQEDESSEDISNIDNSENGSSIFDNESSQQDSVSSNSAQCPQCDAVFAHRHSMMAHVRYKHEGIRFPCTKCDFKAIKQSHLKRHVESIHMGIRYPCKQCDYKSTQQNHLKKHIKSVH